MDPVWHPEKPAGAHSKGTGRKRVPARCRFEILASIVVPPGFPDSQPRPPGPQARFDRGEHPEVVANRASIPADNRLRLQGLSSSCLQ